MKHWTPIHRTLSLLGIGGALLVMTSLRPAENADPSTTTLTIRSLTPGEEGLFDMVITGRTEVDDIYNKRERSHTTPYDLMLAPGQYTIVINRISAQGRIEGKVVRTEKGLSDSVANDAKITVLVIGARGSMTATGL